MSVSDGFSVVWYCLADCQEPTWRVTANNLIPETEDIGMSRIWTIFLSLLAISIAGAVCGQANKTANSTAKVEVPKVERQGVWQPTAGGTQVPLWPANVALAKPDTGDHPEATGNGSPLVGGRKGHWASYVTRPTMTIYRPKGRNTGATMLVLPGGGFHAVATDLEGTEICDWVIQQGMTCVVLKYRTPQVWPKEKAHANAWA